MEKRPPPKNRKLVKQSVAKEKGPSVMRDAEARVLLDGTIDPIIDRATEVIGDRQEAMRWLGAPVRGLDFATPISLLATAEGQMRVNDILGQMEHGIW